MDDAREACPTYQCPHCGQLVSVTPDLRHAGSLKCPHCGGKFVVATDESDSHTNPVRSELDGLRIRQTVALRRGLYRSRSYALIASLACAGAAAQCAYLAWQNARAGGWDLRTTTFLVLMLVAVPGAIYFARRTLALHREARSTRIPHPASAPDFSALSDGSQRARNLDQVE